MCKFGYNGLTGHFFEEEVLGRCTATCGAYLPLREAMVLVRKSQPASKRPAMQRLEAEMSKVLGRPVVFYTAVGSVLDAFHGIDGFFELAGQVVTIDLTINSAKCTGKADLVLQGDEFEDLAALAAKILRFYAPKAERRQACRTIRSWRAA